LDLSEGRVLATGAQQIAQALGGDSAIATLVEQGERLLVICGGLRVELVRSHLEAENASVDSMCNVMGGWTCSGWCDL
jgi:hypothetical protein